MKAVGIVLGCLIGLIGPLSAQAADYASVIGPKLAATINTHPRLYLSTARIIELRDLVKQEPYASLFLISRNVANEGVKKGPPAYYLGKNNQADEQLWQREVGNMIPHLALAYLITQDQKYLAATKNFMLTSVAYPTWGAGKMDGVDLAAAHQLYGLSIGYDWLHSKLSESERTTIRNRLITSTTFVFDKLVQNKTHWATAYLQNHLWVNLAGIAAAGFALYGEAPNAKAWLAETITRLRSSFDGFGSDGASHEGLPYWSYGVEYLLKFATLAKDNLGLDFLTDSAWFKNTADFRIYGALPAASDSPKSSLMTFADGPRSDYYGPDHILRKLASLYQNGQAQFLADFLNQKKLSSAREGGWLNLLWYDQTVKSQTWTNLPTFRHFADQGIIYSRTDWTGAENLMAFKCGAFVGQKGLDAFNQDPGGGHVHPDAGELQIFAHGDWLLTNVGYTSKQTAYQNTAIVNGFGQIGEGGPWFDGRTLSKTKQTPHITQSETHQRYDYIEADVTKAYRPEAKLQSFVRRVIWLKPNLWVIVDDIATTVPATVELFFHSDFAFGAETPTQFLAKGPKGSLRYSLVQPAGASLEAFTQTVKGVGDHDQQLVPCLRIYTSSSSQSTRFISLLDTFPNAGTPTKNYQLTTTNGTTAISTPGATLKIAAELGGQCTVIADK